MIISIFMFFMKKKMVRAKSKNEPLSTKAKATKIDNPLRSFFFLYKLIIMLGLF